MLGFLPIFAFANLTKVVPDIGTMLRYPGFTVHFLKFKRNGR